MRKWHSWNAWNWSGLVFPSEPLPPFNCLQFFRPEIFCGVCSVCHKSTVWKQDKRHFEITIFSKVYLIIELPHWNRILMRYMNFLCVPICQFRRNSSWKFMQQYHFFGNFSGFQKHQSKVASTKNPFLSKIAVEERKWEKVTEIFKQ